MSEIDSDWKAKTRWFAAEYAIVVAGVLTAMVLASWGDRRQESKKEQQYLRQLDADLAATEAVITSDDSQQIRVDSAGTLFLRAFLTVDRPPADSLAAWLYRASSWTYPRPIMATAEALVASGDLGIISNDSLRSEITAYIEHAHQAVADYQLFINSWRLGWTAVLQVVNFAEVTAVASTQAQIDSALLTDPRYILPAGARRHPFPLDWDAILTNRGVYEGVRAMNTAKDVLAEDRTDMKMSAERLRRSIRKAQQKS